jgi:hypothetical protein
LSFPQAMRCAFVSFVSYHSSSRHGSELVRRVVRVRWCGACDARHKRPALSRTRKARYRCGPRERQACVRGARHHGRRVDCAVWRRTVQPSVRRMRSHAHDQHPIRSGGTAWPSGSHVRLRKQANSVRACSRSGVRRSAYGRRSFKFQPLRFETNRGSSAPLAIASWQCR